MQPNHAEPALLGIAALFVSICGLVDCAKVSHYQELTDPNLGAKNSSPVIQRQASWGTSLSGCRYTHLVRGDVGN